MQMRHIVALAALIMVAQFAIWMPAGAFPGFSSNSPADKCHNEPANAYNSSWSSLGLTLDGNKTETFWSWTYGAQMEIPVADINENEIFVAVQFAQNSTHLFTFVSWTDVDTSANTTDGLAMCWNINASDITTYYGSGMATPAAGQAVNTFMWNPSQIYSMANYNTTIGSTVSSMLYDNNGWHTNVLQNYQAAAYWGKGRTSTQYRVEIVRPLVTNEPGDVQFNTDGNYDFTIGIFNDTTGINHMVSFAHSVFVKAPATTTETPGIGLPETFAIIGLASVLGVIVVMKRKRRVVAE